MTHRKDFSCVNFSQTHFPSLSWVGVSYCWPPLARSFRLIFSSVKSCGLLARLVLLLVSIWLLFLFYGRPVGYIPATLKAFRKTSTTRKKPFWRAALTSLALFCFCLPSYSQALDDIPERFASCRPYETQIRAAVNKHFPPDFQYPAVWRAQLYQESLCDPLARSPAGAGGFAQFMRGTQRDISRWLGIDFDRFHAGQSIDAGAYYQAKLTSNFRRRNRTPEQAYELGAASYNAGIGNILKSQRLCGNARLWESVNPCLDQVTGRHAQEPRSYIIRIKRWTNEAEDARPWNVPDGWRADVTRQRRAELQKTVNARRFNSGQSWCSYFPYRGGWVTAGHCHDEANKAQRHPSFVDVTRALVAPGLIDAAFYAVDFDQAAPAEIKAGDIIEVIGFPAGSDSLSYRKARSFLLRNDNNGGGYQLGAMIVVLEAGPRPSFEREAVVPGMSGSPGINQDGEIVCIVVTQNGLVDVTGDGIADHSFDCVPLTRAWEVFK